MKTARIAVRVLLVDDHALIRVGVKRLVEGQSDMIVVGEADNGHAAITQIEKLRPDIVVMDISMPDMSGVQATEQIKAQYPEVKILILSAFNEEAYFRRLLQAGASGYVLKESITDELVHALHSIAQGETYVCATVSSKIVHAYAAPQKAMTDASVLSEREREVLCSIAWGHTNKEIASALHISVKTVETHRMHCMEKLGLQTRAEIVRYALAQGWLQDKSELSS